MGGGQIVCAERAAAAADGCMTKVPGTRVRLEEPWRAERVHAGRWKDWCGGMEGWGLDRGQKARVSLKAPISLGDLRWVCVWEDAGVQDKRARSQVAVNKSALAAAA